MDEALGQVIERAVTFLFVPGDRPDRYEKAAGSGSDLVIIDWEDAVASHRRPVARRETLDYLRTAGPVIIRINPSGTADHTEDLAALRQLSAEGSVAVMLAKTESADAVRVLAAALGPDAAVIALIESASGVAHVRAIAAESGVARLAFGSYDFALDLGVEVDSAVSRQARTELVLASRMHGLPSPIASPSNELEAVDALRSYARTERQEGFGAMLCIHPVQLAAVREGFAPTPAEIDWASTVVDSAGGATRVGTQMIDPPILERARRILTHT